MVHDGATKVDSKSSKSLSSRLRHLVRGSPAVETSSLQPAVPDTTELPKRPQYLPRRLSLQFEPFSRKESHNQVILSPERSKPLARSIPLLPKNEPSCCSYCLSISSNFHANCDLGKMVRCPSTPHQPTLSALYESARLGCDVCRFFTELLEPTPWPMPKSEPDESCYFQQLNSRGGTLATDGRSIRLSQGNQWTCEAILFVQPGRPLLTHRI